MNKQRGFLLLAISISALLALLIVLPFVQYILGAMFLGYVLYPLHIRMRRHLPEMLSGVILILGAFVIVILPVLYIIFLIGQQATRLPKMLEGVDVGIAEETISELTGIEIDIIDALDQAILEFADELIGGTPDILGLLLEILLGVTLLVFLVYYILMEGDRFVSWTKATVPLPDSITNKLYEKVDQTTWAVIIGHIFVAIAQAIIAGFGLWVTGVPNVLFWTFVMVILAFLPVIGVFLVWGPAAGWLLLVGELIPSIFLFVYGFLIVSLVDNYLRSIVVDIQTEDPLNPGVILVSVLGGIYAIGLMGLFIGPIVVGFLKATLVVFRDEYDVL